MSATLDLRKALWANGYRPVAVRIAVLGDKATGKAPTGKDWPGRARQNPPEATIVELTQDAMNTGILCDGLRPVDIDIDDPTYAAQIGVLAFQIFGPAPVRFREGYARALLLYRASEGEPRKVVIDCLHGKVEILGHGQQFVAFGGHYSGTEVQWNYSPATAGVGLYDLSAVAESQVADFLAQATVLLGGLKPSEKRLASASGEHPTWTPPPAGEAPAGVSPRERAYGRATLDGIATDLASMSSGRNDGLNKASFKAGTHIAAGRITETEAIAALWDATCSNGYVAKDGPEEARATMMSGLSKGMTRPAAPLATGLVSPAIDALVASLFAGSRVETDEEATESRSLVLAASAQTTPASSQGAILWPKICAKPFSLTDPAKIPPRQFLYDKVLLRKAVTVTLGHGGGGKSALTIVEDLAMATAKALLAIQPASFTGLRVWAINLEDDKDELDRRFAAAAQYHSVSANDIGDRLFVNGSETDLCIAETTRDGTRICAPDVEAVRAQIRANKIDVVTVDPFVSSHKVTENDNGAIDLVVKQWVKIAADENVAVQLVHHARKTGGNKITDEDGRGAVALKAGARIMRQLNGMTEKEAENAGVGYGDQYDYFCVEDGKRNMSRRSWGGEWYRFESVALTNGDNVGVVTSWTYPAHKVNLTAEQLETVRVALQDGQARKSPQAANYVGKIVADALGISAPRVKSMIARWIIDGALAIVSDKDASRKQVPFVRIKDWRKAVAPPDKD